MQLTGSKDARERRLLLRLSNGTGRLLLSPLRRATFILLLIRFYPLPTSRHACIGEASFRGSAAASILTASVEAFAQATALDLPEDARVNVVNPP
jgi:hypothetical protein